MELVFTVAGFFFGLLWLLSMAALGFGAYSLLQLSARPGLAGLKVAAGGLALFVGTSLLGAMVWKVLGFAVPGLVLNPTAFLLRGAASAFLDLLSFAAVAYGAMQAVKGEPEAAP